MFDPDIERERVDITTLAYRDAPPGFRVLQVLYPDATPAFLVPPATCELAEPRQS